jgi:hypothetical protein
MGRRVRAVVAVALMFPIPVVLSKRLPAAAANGQARRCEIPAEPQRPLYLGRSPTVLLGADSATAESWAIALPMFHRFGSRTPVHMRTSPTNAWRCCSRESLRAMESP